jgi:hypothetical protein
VSPGHERVETLAARLIRVHEADPEIFEEFTKLLSDLGLARRVRVDWFEGLGGDAAGTLSRDKQDTPDALGNVLVDGTNIGLLSDGTLRTFEIVYWLLMRQYGVLWIEEPETAIHPGLLERLLGVIDSYAQDRQVVMSTHSPVVVNWCDPASLRFVERSGHTTRIRPLGPDETQNVIAYLREEGTLDEYVFRPGEAEEP